MLVNTKSEVIFSQFKFLNLETSLDEFYCLFCAYSHVYCNFFVPLDAEASDSISNLRLDWFLIGQTFDHFGSVGELNARLPCAEIEDEIFDVDRSHFIV
jgi:hypothetical protein